MGLTLIELLTVISIISVLAGLLLPALASAKERAQGTTCLNNLRQMGIGMELYRQDQSSHGRFPYSLLIDSNLITKDLGGCLGGQDPAPAFQRRYAFAKDRPLAQYVTAQASFRCPRDAGRRLLGCTLESGPPGPGPGPQKPSNWDTVGCSYQYNVRLEFLAGGGFKLPRLEPSAPCFRDIDDQTEDWVPNPSKFILIHEPPARIYVNCSTGAEWYQWHRRKQASDITDIKAAPTLFFSPVLYVDGHVKMENFSKSLQTDPYYPYEETKDWIWYKPTDTAEPGRAVAAPAR